MGKNKNLYLPFPKILKEQIHPDGTQTIDDFLTGATNKINFNIYLNSTIDYNKSINRNEDLMDLDSIKPKGKGSYSSKSRENKSGYCYICKTHGHSLDDCEFNLLSSKHKNKNNYKNLSKNKFKNNNNQKLIQHNKFKNFKTHNLKTKNKNVYNIEYDEDSSNNEMSFDEIKAMYDKSIDFIENINNENDNVSHDEYTISFIANNSEEKTIWTFDTGASEHIVNNKNILTNFRE